MNLLSNGELEHPDAIPVWALLDFIRMVPKTYWWEQNPATPRYAHEATITGFQRDNGGLLWGLMDVVWIYYTMEWIFDSGFKTLYYSWPTYKNRKCAVHELCDADVRDTMNEIAYANFGSSFDD